MLEKKIHFTWINETYNSCMYTCGKNLYKNKSSFEMQHRAESRDEQPKPAPQRHVNPSVNVFVLLVPAKKVFCFCVLIQKQYRSKPQVKKNNNKSQQIKFYMADMTCDYAIHKPDRHRAEIIRIIPRAPHFFYFSTTMGNYA